MQSLLAAALLASVVLGANKPSKTAKKRAPSCPFVAVADIDSHGAVENLAGSGLPRAGTSVDGFDVDGPVGKLRVTGSGELRYSGSAPKKIRDAAFTHVLLVEGSVKRVHVAEPDKDLPEGIFSSAVTIYLADSKAGRVALVSIPGQSADETCSEIDVKVGGAWKRCWTDCK